MGHFVRVVVYTGDIVTGGIMIGGILTGGGIMPRWHYVRDSVLVHRVLQKWSLLQKCLHRPSFGKDVTYMDLFWTPVYMLWLYDQVGKVLDL